MQPSIYENKMFRAFLSIVMRKCMRLMRCINWSAKKKIESRFCHRIDDDVVVVVVFKGEVFYCRSFDLVPRCVLCALRQGRFVTHDNFFVNSTSKYFEYLNGKMLL